MTNIFNTTKSPRPQPIQATKEHARQHLLAHHPIVRDIHTSRALSTAHHLTTSRTRPTSTSKCPMKQSAVIPLLYPRPQSYARFLGSNNQSNIQKKSRVNIFSLRPRYQSLHTSHSTSFRNLQHPLPPSSTPVSYLISCDAPLR
jgi:hypothetical protein